MSNNTLDKENDSLRSRMSFLNNRLNLVEEATMSIMRLDVNSECLNNLIGERENIKAELKEIHTGLYGV